MRISTRLSIKPSESRTDKDARDTVACKYNREKEEISAVNTRSELGAGCVKSGERQLNLDYLNNDCSLFCTNKLPNKSVGSFAPR
jgi:hypothetical protein